MKGKGFFAAVVRHRKRVLALYILASVLCALLWLLVSVNYDINDYLPPSSPSTKAITVMEDAFGGGIPNVRAMVRDVTIPEALSYKEQISKLDGVTAVTWLDDAVDVTVPLEMQDQKTVEAYYKDGAALFTITVEDAKRTEAVNEISDLLGDQGALTGSAVSTAAATNSTVVEVAQILGRAGADYGGDGCGHPHQQRHQPDVRGNLLCHQRRRQHSPAGGVPGLLGVPDPPV